MQYTRGQFTNDYYRLWELGLHLPSLGQSSIYLVTYKIKNSIEECQITLRAKSINDALERACFQVTYASPWRPEDIDLQAVCDEEENLLWVDEPIYEIIQKKNQFLGMDRRQFLLRFGATSAAVLFGLHSIQARAGTTVVNMSGTANGYPGASIFTTYGTHSWTAPAGVSSVCVVCVGATTFYNNSDSNGRGGGGLGWKNNIPVTPGQSYTVSVAKGLFTSASSIPFSEESTDSYFISPTTVKGGSVKMSNLRVGGTFVGDGGGNGGTGGLNDASNIGGGGGAGGYSGNGGNGGSGTSNGSAGAGGGGGGGGSTSRSAKVYSYNYGIAVGQQGGGVGLYGQGANGAGGIYAPGTNITDTSTNTFVVEYRGGGGSGGDSGSYPSHGASSPTGYGVGLASTTSSDISGGGAPSGAVRIIWGAGRSFPSNA